MSADRSPGVIVSRVGLLGPGLPSWPAGRDILASRAEWPLAAADSDAIPDEMATAKLDTQLPMLPPNERRRATPTIKIALHVAHEALDGSAQGFDTRAVFACSGGDTATLDRICDTLSAPGRPVSPAQFHKSVHNAPAGFWSIATGSHAATTSLSAFDSTFAAGLMEAYACVLDASAPVLLVAYDTPPPLTLLPFRPLKAAFAVALLLRPDAAPAAGELGRLRLTLADRGAESGLAHRGLETLRGGNPAARALPLLAALAGDRSGAPVALPYLDGSRLLAEVELASDLRPAP